MKDLAKQTFDAALAIAPGLQNLGQEVAAEIKRLGTQGQMELASALFNGQGFVPYGPGQYTPSPVEHGQDHAVELPHELEHEMGHER